MRTNLFESSKKAKKSGFKKKNGLAIKHYQHISDREAYLTAEMVHQGIESEYETLIRAFDKDYSNFHRNV